MAPPKSRYAHFPEEVDKFSPDVNPTERYSLEHLTSDVDDPVWPSEGLDYGPDRTQPVGGGQAVEDDPVIRTVSGLLDLLHHVRDEVDEWIERESDGEGHKWPRRHDKAMILQTYSRGSRFFRPNTFNIGVAAGGTQIAFQKSPRHSVVVQNISAAIVYISHLSIPWPPGAGVAGGAIPNTCQIGVGLTREFATEAAIWAYPAVAGTPQLIDVVEYLEAPNDQPYS
jgi:hypothetical protein